MAAPVSCGAGRSAGCRWVADGLRQSASVVLAKSPSGNIERKARLATFDVDDEFLQSIRSVIFVRSRCGGLKSRGRHKVAMAL